MILLSYLNYFLAILILSTGIYIVLSKNNLIKKLVGLSIFQTSVYLIFVAPGKIVGGTPPIINNSFSIYSSPVPHVLILTAIVVGVATFALGLAITIKIKERYGSIEEDEIEKIEKNI